jgi:hypothetical protein
VSSTSQKHFGQISEGLISFVRCAISSVVTAASGAK